MSDMIERVARAIHTLRHNTPEQQARAAIEAMREPTEAMLAEVIKEPVHLYEGRDDDYVKLMKAATAADRLAARQRWQDLIDAALKGEAE